MIRQFQNGFTPGPLGTGAGLVRQTSLGILHPLPIAFLKAPTFRRITFEPVVADQGFDPTTTPPWQMVPWSDPAKPVSGANTRQVRVDLKGLAPSDLSIGSNDKSIADIKGVSAGIMEITGRSPGTCFIQIFRRSSGEVIAELEVTVKAPLEFSISYFEVIAADKAGESNRFTRSRKPTDLTTLLSAVNGIIQPQTNITFKASSTTTGIIATPDALGRVVSEDEALKLIGWMVRTTDVAVVFVKDYNTKNTGGDSEEAVTFNENDTIFIDDKIGDRLGKHDATVLAHEIGHWLLHNSKKSNADDRVYGKGRNHSGNFRDLMHSTSLKGRRIRKRESNEMNESGLVPRAFGKLDQDQFRSIMADLFG